MYSCLHINYFGYLIHSIKGFVTPAFQENGFRKGLITGHVICIAISVISSTFHWAATDGIILYHFHVKIFEEYINTVKMHMHQHFAISQSILAFFSYIDSSLYLFSLNILFTIRIKYLLLLFYFFCHEGE